MYAFFDAKMLDTLDENAFDNFMRFRCSSGADRLVALASEINQKMEDKVGIRSRLSF